MMLSSHSFQSHTSPRHPVPSPAPSGGVSMGRSGPRQQEEPLRRLSAGHSSLVTNTTDPFVIEQVMMMMMMIIMMIIVIEQLHKLELNNGRLNNVGGGLKEAGQGTDSAQLQVIRDINIIKTRE